MAFLLIVECADKVLVDGDDEFEVMLYVGGAFGEGLDLGDEKVFDVVLVKALESECALLVEVEVVSEVEGNEEVVGLVVVEEDLEGIFDGEVEDGGEEVVEGDELLVLEVVDAARVVEGGDGDELGDLEVEEFGDVGFDFGDDGLE